MSAVVWLAYAEVGVAASGLVIGLPVIIWALLRGLDAAREGEK